MPGAWMRIISFGVLPGSPDRAALLEKEAPTVMVEAKETGEVILLEKGGEWISHIGHEPSDITTARKSARRD